LFIYKITSKMDTEYKKISNGIEKARKKWKIKENSNVKFETQIKVYEFLRKIHVTGKIKDNLDEFDIKEGKGRDLLKRFKKEGFHILFPKKRGVDKEFSDAIRRKMMMLKVAYSKLSDADIATIMEYRKLVNKVGSRTVWAVRKEYDISVGRGECLDEILALDRIKQMDCNKLIQFMRALDNLEVTLPPKGYSEKNFQSSASFQKRYEMIRESILKPEETITNIAKKYGILQENYYVYLRRFLEFGILGLLDKAKGRFRKFKITPEKEISIIRMWEKGKHSQEQISKQLGISIRAVVSILVEYGLTKDAKNVIKIKKDMKKQKYRGVNRDSKLLCTGVDKNKEKFLLRVEELRVKEEPVPIPAGFLIAPFINELKVFEVMSGMGVTKLNGYDIPRLMILDIMRIFGRVQVLGGMDYITDDALALAAGLHCDPAQNTLHENIVRIGEENIKKIKWTFAHIAKSLDIFNGTGTAIDFYLSIFTGTDETMIEEGGKGPCSMRKTCLPGYRPLIAYDYIEDTLITYKKYAAKERGPKVTMEFIEEELEYVLGVGTLKSLLGDAEFRGIEIYDRLTAKGILFTFALIENGFIKGQIDHLSDKWKKWKDDFIIHTTLFNKGKPTRYTLIAIRDLNSKPEDFRCFVTNRNLPTGEYEEQIERCGEIIEEYHFRSRIEAQIQRLISDVYFNKVPTTQSEGADFHFLTSLLANYIFELVKKELREIIGKRTLKTIAEMYFNRKKMMLSVQGDYFVIKSIDKFKKEKYKQGFEKLKSYINGYKKPIPWLYGMKIRVE